MRVQLNILKNDLDEAVQNKDFVRAQELKVQMEELDEGYNKLQDELTEAAAMASRPSRTSDVAPEKQTQAAEQSRPESAMSTSNKEDDPAVVHKCMVILYQLMQDPAIKTLDNTLHTLLDELIMPSIRHLDAEIRMSAVRSLGVFSLRNIDVAKRNLLLLFQIGHIDIRDVRLVALAMVNDLLLWYGLGAFASEGGTGAEDSGSGASKNQDEQSNIESLLENLSTDTSRREVSTIITLQGHYSYLFHDSLFLFCYRITT